MAGQAGQVSSERLNMNGVRSLPLTTYSYLEAHLGMMVVALNCPFPL
jgi:hypothetical protein